MIIPQTSLQQFPMQYFQLWNKYLIIPYNTGFFQTNSGLPLSLLFSKMVTNVSLQITGRYQFYHTLELVNIFQIVLNVVSLNKLSLIIAFSKVFHPIDHIILSNKFNQYHIRNEYHDWFKCYWNEWKQFIYYSEENISLGTIRCGALQELMLGPLLFLIFVNDLQYATNMLNPYFFSNSTSFFELYCRRIGKFNWLYLNLNW